MLQVLLQTHTHNLICLTCNYQIGSHCPFEDCASRIFGQCACQTGATSASAPVSSSDKHCQCYLHSIQHGFHYHYHMPHNPSSCHRPRRPAGCVETMSQTLLGCALLPPLAMNCVICAKLIMSRGVASLCLCLCLLLPDRMRRLSTQHNLLELPSSLKRGLLNYRQQQTSDAYQIMSWILNIALLTVC